MEPDHDRIESILVTALEIQTEIERQKYVQQACGDDMLLKLQVDELIQNHFLAGSFLNVPDQLDSSSDCRLDNEGSLIGPYTLLQKIGEGGMGVVYLAEQAKPFRRQVAVKIIRAGMDSEQVVARFEQERQALAVMDHPNIARVIDGGLTTDGRPYFAMELIQGLPITEYCDKYQLPLRQRLELFVPVCLAIQHAHQKGIIHRDLKPSNVLVTEADGRRIPKVIDFGVAKAVGTRLTSDTLDTHLGTIIGTLEYMSPEQAVPDQEDIDTRSDIYCLGVLLFELLTGTTPLQRQEMREVTVLELLRIIREDETPTPSHRLSTIHDLFSVAASRGVEPRALSHVVRGDLDWIVMKCLEKDRNRRYSAANGIARDIERFLSDEPIEAGPPGAGYRMRKFLWRNRWAAAVVTILLLTMYGGIVGTSIGLIQASRGRAAASQALQVAEHQRDRAERHYQRALSAVDRLLTRVGGVGLESLPHMDETRRQLLEDALEFYNEILQDESDDPVLRREVGLAWQRVGDIQGQLGNKQAEVSLQRAIDIQHDLLVEFPQESKYNDDTIRSRRYLAFELFRSGRLMEAERMVDEALSHHQFTTMEAQSEEVLLLYLRGTLFASTQKRDEAILACKQALAKADGLVRREPSRSSDQLDRARILSYLGHLYREDRRLDEAENCFQDSKRVLEQLLTNDPSDKNAQANLAGICCNLGLTFANLGRRADAIAANDQAIAIFETLVRDHPGLPDFKWQMAKTYNNIGLLHLKNEDIERAVVENEKALAIFRDLMQSYPQRPEFITSFAGGCGNQGKYLGDLERWDESLVWNSKAIEAADQLLAIEPRHTETRRFLHGSLIGRAGTYRRFKQVELALADYRRSLELSQGERHVSYVNFRPRALAFIGEHKQASEAAEAIVSNADATDSNFSEMAKVYATCVEAVGRDSILIDAERHELAEQYAVRSVELLSRAAEKGRFSTLEHVADLRSDDRLQSIQNRDDLKQFLSELEHSIQLQK